jgi:hypothetical protein
MITATGLAFAGAGTASAAEGVIFVDGQPYFDPAGCYNLDPPAVIHNRTDETVSVFLFPDCQGPVIHRIHPFHHPVVTEEGHSFFVE